jgi:hypothetical protein
MSMSFGVRPDVTPAQLAGVLLAGLPIAANLLHGLGVYDVPKDQQQALRDAGRWGAVSAVGLFLADAALRSARSYADAQVQVASLAPPPAQAGTPIEPPFTRRPGATGMADEEEAGLLEEVDAGLLPVDAAGLVDEEEAALLEELDAGLLPTDAEELGEGEEPETSVVPDDPDAPETSVVPDDPDAP